MFYDLTAKNFLRSINYCLLDHYSNGNAYAVCSIEFQEAKKNIQKLNHNDFELIRRLPSFRTYVEHLLKTDQAQLVIDIFQKDETLRKQLPALIRNIYMYFSKFYGQIRLLWTLVKDLPNASMGKRLVDVYMHCQSAENGFTETEEFKKCWQLLGMTSKEEFLKLLNKCVDCLENYEEMYCDKADDIIHKDTKRNFDRTFELLNNSINELRQDRSSTEISNKVNPSSTQQQHAVTDNAVTNRTMYYQNLMQQNKAAMAKQSSITRNILDKLRVHMEGEILPWKKAPPLFELFVYSDFDQIRSHLRGTSRSAIHKALTDPNAYLQVLQNDMHKFTLKK